MALSSTEQKIVNDAKAAYTTLSAEAKADLAQFVSWGERNFWPAIAVAAAVGLALGYVLFHH